MVKEKRQTTIYKTLHRKLKIEASLLNYFRNAFRYIFSGVRVTRSLVLCVCFAERCLSSCIFSLATVLSVFLGFTYFDYPFGIFKLFLKYTYMHSKQREWIQTKRRKGDQSHIRTKQKDQHIVIN